MVQERIFSVFTHHFPPVFVGERSSVGLLGMRSLAMVHGGRSLIGLQGDVRSSYGTQVKNSQVILMISEWVYISEETCLHPLSAKS